MRLRWYLLAGSVLIVASICIYLEVLAPPDPGSFAHTGVQRIQALCGSRTDCEVTLRDVFPGDWDTFYEFGYDVSQHDVSETLHTHMVWVSDLRNIYALSKDGRVVRSAHGETGQEQPLAGEIEFSGGYDPHHPGWQKYPASARFKVKTCPTSEGGKLFGPYGGTSYLLVLSPVRSDYTTQCQSPSG